MITETILKQYPNRWIEAADGLIVTADVWQYTQEYHRQRVNFHALFNRGPGIITGLEVVATDPPGSSLYVLPGIAVDAKGQIIVVQEPELYPLGLDIDGLLYFFLSYHKSEPKPGHKDYKPGDPLYIRAEYSLAARSECPPPAIELARIRRSKKDAMIVNAVNYNRPRDDEIDLNFRREVGPPSDITIGICYLGQVQKKHHGVALGQVVRSLNRTGYCWAQIEDDLPFDRLLTQHNLIYLVGQGAFGISEEIRDSLQRYVLEGFGTLLIEAIDDTAESLFQAALDSMAIQLEVLPADHPLLTRPYLFAAPPSTTRNKAASIVRIGGGTVMIDSGYSWLWQGRHPEGLPSREEIRAAMEWGSNLIAYAVERRRISGRRAIDREQHDDSIG